MKKLYPALVCGFGAGVLQVVPIIKSFACCLILPAAALFAIVLDQKASNSFQRIEISKGLILGLLTGLFAAFFGSSFEILITLLTKKNDMVLTFGEMQNFMSNIPLSAEVKTQVIQIFSEMVDEIKETGFSTLYSATIIMNSLVTNVIFGLIGGVFGTQYWNAKVIKRSREE